MAAAPQGAVCISDVASERDVIGGAAGMTIL
jgi:hypothetical protein